MGIGPGSLFQIDATIGDVYLVSSLDRLRVIGRPVIYVVIDVATRLITGMAVILEGPSWLGMRLAIENMAADKVKFCAEHGITIVEREWPSHHLPLEILGDRGELLSKNGDKLTKNLGVKVGNTASYRCDWKAICERRFRILNDTTISWLPGHVDPEWVRGDRDYVLDACLTLKEFRQIVIECIRHHNNSVRMPWYRMDEYKITDSVEPYPVDLWEWGVQNRGGSMRIMPQEIVRRNLLPEARATVTQAGIIYGGLEYTCDLAERENWYTKARHSGTWTVPIVYDQSNTGCIFLCLEDGKLEPCELLDNKQGGRDWYERLDYMAIQSIQNRDKGERDVAADIELDANTDEIIRAAQEKKNEAFKAHGRMSKSAQRGDIRENRAEERELERGPQLEAEGVFPLDNAHKERGRAGQPQEEHVQADGHLVMLADVRKRKQSGMMNKENNDER
jgi:hypothetical protein